MNESKDFPGLNEEEEKKLLESLEIPNSDINGLYQYLKKSGTKEEIEEFIKDFNWQPEAVEAFTQIKKLQSDALVVQSNELAEASQDLTAIELRLVYNLIGLLNPVEEEDFISTKVYIKDLATLCDLDPKSAYGQIDKACTNIMKKPVILTNTDRNGKKITLRRSWFVQLDTFEGEGYIMFKFHPDLKAELLQFHKYGRGFVTTKGNILNRLGDVFPMRFFTLMMKNLKFGTCEYSIDQIIEMFQLQGKYVDKRTGTVNSAMFIKRVIDSAVEKINRISDITVQYKPVKAGRRIESIRFFMHKKTGVKNVDNTATVTAMNKPTIDEDISWMKSPDIAKELDKLNSLGFSNIYRSAILGKFKNKDDFMIACETAIKKLHENHGKPIENKGAFLYSKIMEYNTTGRLFAEEEKQIEQENLEKIRARRTAISLAKDWTEIIEIASKQTTKEYAIAVFKDGQEYRPDLLKKFEDAYYLTYKEKYEIDLEIARISVHGVGCLVPVPNVDYNLLEKEQ